MPAPTWPGSKIRAEDQLDQPSLSILAILSALAMSLDFAAVEAGSSSDHEIIRPSVPRVKKVAAGAAVFAAVAALTALASMHSPRKCTNLGALQGKVEVNVNEAMLANSKELTAVKDQSKADEIVLGAMKKGGLLLILVGFRAWSTWHVLFMRRCVPASSFCTCSEFGVSAICHGLGCAEMVDGECAG